MKIRIEERLGQSETEILILCEKQNEETDRIKTHLGMLEKTLLGKKQDRQVVLRPKDVLYFESVDDKVLATLFNREQIEITRTYVAELKQALGGLHR